MDHRELLALLKDPAVVNYLRGQIVQNATVTGIGRFPGQGSAQNDNYVYPDAADASFPYNFDYEIPNNFQRIISARLSFKIRPYRTYSSITLTATGSALGTHTHSHNHAGGSHNHSTHYANGVTTPNVQLLADSSLRSDAGALDVGTSTNGVTTDTDATASGSLAHTHTVSGTTTLGIAEDAAPVSPGITVSVDGADVTGALGGPFNADMVEIDVTRVLVATPKIWHTMALQPNQRVRLTGILRISYLVDSRLAQ